jgi:hypothetical protein
MKSSVRYNHFLPSLLLSLILITLNIVRISAIPITIDETGYVPTEGYWETMFKSYPSANNHILQSLLRKLFIELFSDSVFFYRLDLLLAHMVFLVIAYRLMVLLFRHGGYVFAAFATLNLVSPWVFEFWGLSRGYGLGLMFMIGSIYAMLQYLNSGVARYLVVSVCCAGLSAYSNFSFLNVCAGLLGAFVVTRFIFRNSLPFRPKLFTELLCWVIPSIVFTLLFTGPLSVIKSGGELKYLGTSGFKADTVTSIVKCCIYDNGNRILTGTIVRIVYYGTLVISISWAAIWMKREKLAEFGQQLQTGIFLHLLLLIPFWGQLLQFHFFRINYVVDRAGIFFVLLYVLQLLYWLYVLKIVFLPQIRFVIAGLAILLGGFFFINVNVVRTYLWWFDACDLVVLKRMVGKEPHKKQLRIWVDWRLTPALAYNISHYFPGRYQVAESAPSLPQADTSFDFVYVFNYDTANLAVCYILDTTCLDCGLKLYRRQW